MTNPFREAPLMLACPRCGENLNEVSGDVSMCAQCGGIWLSQPAITTAFQDPTWPHGVAMWWRRELVCPVCAAQGSDETMASVYVDDLLLDRCTDHGLWFDRGELARLIGSTPAKELDRLKTLLETAHAPKWVVEEQEKRDAERKQREAELQAREDEAARAAENARAKSEAAARAAVDEAARKRRQQAARIDLTKEREQLGKQIETIVSGLAKLRESISADEERLREMRARLRTVQNQLAALDP